MLSRALVVAVLAGGALGVLQAQNPAGQAPAAQQPAPATNADPYFNNANPGATQFPLAAPAGNDSKAATTAPAGA